MILQRYQQKLKLSFRRSEMRVALGVCQKTVINPITGQSEIKGIRLKIFNYTGNTLISNIMYNECAAILLIFIIF